jgi:dimethylhistidine N-methyltransferase
MTFPQSSDSTSLAADAEAIARSSLLENRLRLERLIDPSGTSATEIANAADVVAGLTKTPKTLPPKYFYDDRGSQLFEQICDLPEYYPTRTEAAILRQYAPEIAKLTGNCEIVELGSGSSTKTRILLDAYHDSDSPLHYVPVDVSGGILESSARELLVDYPSLQVHGLVSTYELALEQLPTYLPSRTICFLGSSLGNLNPEECDIFFSQIVEAMQPEDYFLLGMDLHKSKAILEPAYNDAQGVTAAFNLNMLQHLNWRFDGNFNPEFFEHRAFYNEEKRRIEMHLHCLRSHAVRLRGLDLTVDFEAGESILTEISRKFDIERMQSYLQQKQLAPVQSWTDENGWFGLLLCQRQPN